MFQFDLPKLGVKKNPQLETFINRFLEKVLILSTGFVALALNVPISAAPATCCCNEMRLEREVAAQQSRQDAVVVDR